MVPKKSKHCPNYGDFNAQMCGEHEKSIEFLEEEMEKIFRWRDTVMVDMTKLQTKSAVLGAVIGSIPGIIISCLALALKVLG